MSRTRMIKWTGIFDTFAYSIASILQVSAIRARAAVSLRRDWASAKGGRDYEKHFVIQRAVNGFHGRMPVAR